MFNNIKLLLVHMSLLFLVSKLISLTAECAISNIGLQQSFRSKYTIKELQFILLPYFFFSSAYFSVCISVYQFTLTIHYQPVNCIYNSTFYSHFNRQRSYLVKDRDPGIISSQSENVGKIQLTMQLSHLSIIFENSWFK